MRFFLYEIVARIAGLYLAFDCGRQLRRAFTERKIGYYKPDLLDWLWTYDPVQRDKAPIRYWIEVGIRVTLLLACLFVAIFGWWHPDS